jgi:hypothetical protein
MGDEIFDVGKWLNELGLGRYADAFVDNDIDAEVLSELTDGFLKDLGVDSVGHRVKLLKAIARLKGADASSAPATNTDVATSSHSADAPAAALSAVPAVAPKIAPPSAELMVGATRRGIACPALER